MTLKLDDRQYLSLALPSVTVSGAITGQVAINATGYGRARFVFTFGTPLASASLSSMGIWNSSASTAYVSISSAQLLPMTTASMSNNVAVIDTIVNSAYPWLYISGAMATSNQTVSATVELYNGTRLNPPTSTLSQPIVTV